METTDEFPRTLREFRKMYLAISPALSAEFWKLLCVSSSYCQIFVWTIGTAIKELTSLDSCIILQGVVVSEGALYSFHYWGCRKQFHLIRSLLTSWFVRNDEDNRLQMFQILFGEPVAYLVRLVPTYPSLANCIEVSGWICNINPYIIRAWCISV